MVNEPLFLVHAEQSGTQMYQNPKHGNLAMHRAMAQVGECIPQYRPPRALQEPTVDMRGLENLVKEDETSIQDALAALGHA